MKKAYYPSMSIHKIGTELAHKIKFKFDLFISLNQITGLLLFFVIGLYGYPTVTFAHNTLAGLIIRFLSASMILFLFLMWLHSLLNLRKTSTNHETVHIFFDYKDLLKLILFFILIIVFKYQELQSSITGDEISLYGNSVETSTLILEKLNQHFSIISNVAARLVIATIQLGQIFFGILCFMYLRRKKSGFKITIYLLTLVVFYTFRMQFFNGTYAYPNAEVLPYYLLSPVTLILDVNPRIISYFIFALFLLAIYNVILEFTKSSFLSFLLVVLLISLPMTSDIGTSINHAVYYVYILAFIIIRIALGYELDTKAYSICLLMSVFRPTLFPILLILICILNLNRTNKYEIKKLFNKYKFIFISTILVQGIIIINKLTDFAFALKASNPQANPSLTSRFLALLENLFMLDLVSAILLILLFLILIFENNFRFIVIFLASILIFAVTAPFENLKVPIYKTEILLPFLFLSCAKLLVWLISFTFRDRVNSLNLRLIWSVSVIFLTLFNILYMINSKLPETSWSARYDAKKLSNESIYITYGKINYRGVIEDIDSFYKECKFLDVTYDGAFLLESDISTANYLDIAKKLNIRLSELSKNNSGQCVIVGNYLVEEVLYYASQKGIGLSLLTRYTNDNLGTTVYLFETYSLG